MAGASLNVIRSASVAEAAKGTTPATPAFLTSDKPIAMVAKTEAFAATSLAFNGAPSAVGVAAIPVTGSIAGQLIYGNLDNWLETLLQGAWATNVLKNGTTRLTRTVENTVPAGEGGTSTMLRYRGVEAVGGKLTLANGAPIEYSLDLVGMGSDNSTTTPITGATYTDPTVTVPLMSGLDVGSITMAGYTPGGIQSAEISFDYTDRDVKQLVSTLDTDGAAIGAFAPKIAVKALVDTSFAAMYDAARALHTQFAVNFPLGSVSGSKYTLQFPKCSFGNADLDLSGNVLLQDLDIIPQYDTTNSAVVVLTRALA